MEVQPQLVLLQKTLLNIEGLGRDLYPDLDLWQTAKPFLERWFKDELGPMASLSKLREELPLWAQHWPDMPMLAHRALSDAANGKLTVNFRSHEMDALRQDLRFNQRRLLMAVTGGSLLVCGSVVLAAGVLPMLASLSAIAGLTLLGMAWIIV
jgi:ubiquinone biosynthesis protein